MVIVDGKEIVILSHPSRGEWIEISTVSFIFFSASSHPSRGEWIEMRPSVYSE